MTGRMTALIAYVLLAYCAAIGNWRDVKPFIQAIKGDRDTLETINTDGSRETWGVTATATPSADAGVITDYALYQNYPNPFNQSTNLMFDVMSQDFVSLTVCNVMGQRVATIVNGTMEAGRHTVTFDASDLTSGTYYYTITIGKEFAATKEMVLVK